MPEFTVVRTVQTLVVAAGFATLPGMVVKMRRRIIDERVDTRVIRDSIGGKRVNAIAAELRISPERVENIIVEWTASAVTPELRRQEFVRLLAQIDAVIEGLFPRAVAGEHTAIADLNKIWGRKIGVLGLRAPETAILRVIEETIPAAADLDGPRRNGPSGFRNSALLRSARPRLGGSLRAWNLPSSSRSSPPPSRVWRLGERT